MDRIVHFAAAEFEMPIVLISLIDENRQWFKSCMGMEVRETDLNISFCGQDPRPRSLDETDQAILSSLRDLVCEALTRRTAQA